MMAVDTISRVDGKWTRATVQEAWSPRILRQCGIKSCLVYDLLRKNMGFCVREFIQHCLQPLHHSMT